MTKAGLLDMVKSRLSRSAYDAKEKEFGEETLGPSSGISP